MKAFPTTSSLDTIPTLTEELVKSIPLDPTHPSTRHASEESATFVLVFFFGDWYKVPAENFNKIAKLASKVEYPYDKDGELKIASGDDDEAESTES